LTVGILQLTNWTISRIHSCRGSCIFNLLSPLAFDFGDNRISILITKRTNNPILQRQQVLVDLQVIIKHNPIQMEGREMKKEKHNNVFYQSRVAALPSG